MSVVGTYLWLQKVPLELGLHLVVTYLSNNYYCGTSLNKLCNQKIQKELFGCFRNSSSWGVDLRPSILLRCGYRPNISMIALCCRSYPMNHTRFTMHEGEVQKANPLRFKLFVKSFCNSFLCQCKRQIILRKRSGRIPIYISRELIEDDYFSQSTIYIRSPAVEFACRRSLMNITKSVSYCRIECSIRRVPIIWGKLFKPKLQYVIGTIHCTHGCIFFRREKYLRRGSERAVEKGCPRTK